LTGTQPELEISLTNNSKVMTDIIKVILENKNKDAGMPAEAFFTDNNSHGYMSITNFKAMLANINNRELVDFSALLEHMGCRVPFDSVPSISYDEKNTSVIWMKARLARSNQSLKLPGEKALITFIKDYQYGKISPNFDLDNLYKVANPVEVATDNLNPAN
jgi:hypothetical protein